SALVISSRARGDLLFRIFLTDLSDPRSHRRGRDSARQPLSSRRRTITRPLATSVVCADAVVVLGRASHVGRAVLGGDVGFAATCLESVAARHAGHLLHVFSVVRQRRSGLLQLPIRWHAAGGWLHQFLSCPARIPPRTWPPAS